MRVARSQQPQSAEIQDIVPPLRLHNDSPSMYWAGQALKELKYAIRDGPKMFEGASRHFHSWLREVENLSNPSIPRCLRENSSNDCFGRTGPRLVCIFSPMYAHTVHL